MSFEIYPRSGDSSAGAGSSDIDGNTPGASPRVRTGGASGRVRIGRDDTVVLKFGSSILTHEAEIWSVVTEIQRHIAAGRRVVAVVSALWGVTDELLAQARKVVDSLDGPALARLLATGEQVTSSLLSLALTQARVGHALLDARQLRLTAEGSRDDAEPVSVDRGLLRSTLAKVPVVVVPGFEAIDESGQLVVLGRGGSDLTAIFIADALDAQVRLVKDVDGVFEFAPPHATSLRPRPRRFRTIAWDLVPKVAGKLVQSKGVAFAQERNLAIRVVTLGSDVGTLIADTTEFEAPMSEPASGVRERDLDGLQQLINPRQSEPAAVSVA